MRTGSVLGPSILEEIEARSTRLLSQLYGYLILNLELGSLSLKYSLFPLIVVFPKIKKHTGEKWKSLVLILEKLNLTIKNIKHQFCSWSLIWVLALIFLICVILYNLPKLHGFPSPNFLVHKIGIIIIFTFFAFEVDYT